MNFRSGAAGFFLCPKSRTGCSVKNTAFKAEDRERFSGLRALGFLQIQYAGPALAPGTRRSRSKTGNVFWVGAAEVVRGGGD